MQHLILLRLFVILLWPFSHIWFKASLWYSEAVIHVLFDVECSGSISANFLLWLLAKKKKKTQLKQFFITKMDPVLVIMDKI